MIDGFVDKFSKWEYFCLFTEVLGEFPVPKLDEPAEFPLEPCLLKEKHVEIHFLLSH